MKQGFVICISLLIFAVLICGCTSQPATAPVTPVAADPQATEVTHMETTSFIGTNWQLEWFDDTKGMWSKVAEGSTVTATFSADGKLTGFSGCSDYTTEYQLTESQKIWITRPAVKEKVCQTPIGVMSQESVYYTDLEWAETYSMKDGQLLLFDKTGKKILQFDKAP
ncbi:MAG: META domain-containing protein [Methanoregula sp.]|nr:META domain-containing protein [Methanoregula sp.]